MRVHVTNESDLIGGNELKVCSKAANSQLFQSLSSSPCVHNSLGTPFIPLTPLKTSLQHIQPYYLLVDTMANKQLRSPFGLFMAKMKRLDAKYRSMSMSTAVGKVNEV
ncbi:unnamed protein product, partial [Oppiella nova]